MVIFQSAEYGRTRRDLVRAEPILAACTVRVCNTIFYKPECGCMPIERLSIKRMRDFGAFAAFSDYLNFKFSRGNMPPDPPVMFMLYHSVHSKERLQTRLQTNYQTIHSYITSPYWGESKSVSKGCRKPLYSAYWVIFRFGIDMFRFVYTYVLQNEMVISL